MEMFSCAACQDSNGNIVGIFEVSIQSNIQSDYYLFRT